MIYLLLSSAIKKEPSYIINSGHKVLIKTFCLQQKSQMKNKTSDTLTTIFIKIACISISKINWKQGINVYLIACFDNKIIINKKEIRNENIK